MRNYSNFVPNLYKRRYLEIEIPLNARGIFLISTFYKVILTIGDHPKPVILLTNSTDFQVAPVSIIFNKFHLATQIRIIIVINQIDIKYFIVVN